MDQIKKLLAGAKKNAFWIVSALTIVLGIVGYWLSRSTMDKIFADQSTKIDSQYSALSTISNEVATHPNAKTHAEMDKQIAALTEDVQKAWAKQYERQAEILKWPADKIPAKFIAKVEKLRPIELALEYPLVPTADPLVQGDKMQYAKYINEQFPELARIIGTEWVGTPPAVGSGGGMGGYAGTAGGMPGGDMYGGGDMYSGASGDMGGTMMSGDPMMMGSGMMPGMAGNMMFNRKPDLVVWPKTVQDAVIADVQTWRSKYPTTHDILYTQENIWILKGLLEIIGKVNAKANAVANFQATVKEIEFLRIGRSAVGKVGVIDRPGLPGMGMGMGMDSAMGGMDYGMETGGMDAAATGSEGAMGMDSGMGGGDMYGSEMGGEGAEGGMGGMVMPTPDPANGRYVDAAYAPLTGDDLRTKMKSEAPEDAYFAVAKRVPVRMRLKVDQRRIQTLIAECGNANLLFEIRQIRIGDTTPAPVASAGGSYGMDPYGGSAGSMPGGDVYSGDAGMAGSSDMSMGMPGGDMYSGGMGMGMGMGVGSTAKVWDTPVEIYGIVYLFNPPDPKKLGLNKVTAETEVEDKVEVSADVVQANEAQQAPPPAAADQATDTAAEENGQPGQVAPGGAANPPARNAPTGNAPTGNVPAGNVPAGNVPAGNVPAGNAPAVAPGGNPPAANPGAGNPGAGNAGAGNAGAGNAAGGNAATGNGAVPNAGAAGGGTPPANNPQ